ncbi:hypothetical protein FXW78_54180 [Rhodococcus opacus]|nr:hypothetical protein [Rhodococcus opacus]
MSAARTALRALHAAAGIDPHARWRVDEPALAGEMMRRKGWTLEKLREQGITRAQTGIDADGVIRTMPTPFALAALGPAPRRTDHRSARSAPGISRPAPHLVGAYRGDMSTDPVRDNLIRRQSAREELVLQIRELEGHLARAPTPTRPSRRRHRLTAPHRGRATPPPPQLAAPEPGRHTRGSHRLRR